MENLVSFLLFSHPDLSSLTLLGRIKRTMRAWWDFSLCTELLIFFNYQRKENCHVKETIVDYWSDDLISSEAEIWSLHQWHQHCEITDQTLPSFTWHGRRLGGTGIQSPAPPGIFLALLIRWPAEDWAATAWSRFLLPQAQPNPVALEKSSSVTAIPILPKPILIPAAQGWLHYQQTDITHCKSERKPFQTIPCIFIPTASLFSIIP